MNRPDFRIYTASLIPDGDPASTIVRMTGSSTERDVQKNYMGVDALRDMQQPAVLGMNIFLNHKYDLPYDLYGRLIDIPTIAAADGFLDVELTVETDVKNAAAAQTLQQIRDGHKHGSSIGCMVDEWEFAGESDNPQDDAVIIKRVTPVEWSVVGIPANRRCWVENAISGKFMRTLEEGDYDQALQLAPTVKSLFSYDYEKLVTKLNAQEQKRFATVRARYAPPVQLFWQPARSTFVLQSPSTPTADLSRPQVTTFLQSTWTLADEQRTLTATAGDGGKAAQQARASRYGIGIKDGGNVTKPGKWSSVPDGQWGDPVNYRYPMPEISHANNAASRWGDASNRSQYNRKEQGIIGGRITRRQHALGGGSDSKEKTMDPNAIYNEDGVLVTTLDAQGMHSPHDGTHTHAHIHGPNAGGTHSHPHLHHNDNLHQHDHTGNIDGDGGAPDGDGDSDEWNEPDFPSGGSNAVPAPNDASSNTGRANNAGSSSAPTAAGTQLPPNVLNATEPVAVHDEALLAHYNKVGASLGFAPVNTTGVRSDSTTLTGDNVGTFTLCVENLRTLGTKLEQSVLAMAEELHVPLGGNAPEVKLEALPVDLTLAAAKAGPLHPAHAVHAQAAHDHANAMLGGKGCSNYANSTSAAATPDVTASAPEVPNDLQERLTTMQANLDAAEQRATTLATQIEQLQGRGFGRPTTFTQRAAPVDYEGQSIEVQTPDALRAGTSITRRRDGVLCRAWPAGHGVHQRPMLSSDQMSIMSLPDMDAYRTGQAVLVPMIYDGD